MRRVLPCVALILALGGLVLAQEPQRGKSDRDKGQANREGREEQFSDEHFVKKASECNLAEINIGRLAQTRASSPEVKRFAEKMVQDHTKANQEILQLANQKGWTLASTMGEKHQQCWQKLSQKQGQDFDRDYMKDQLKGHEEAVDLFTKASKHCKDEGLKNFASKTLPTIQEHLKMAKQLAGQGATPVSKEPERR